MFLCHCNILDSIYAFFEKPDYQLRLDSENTITHEKYNYISGLFGSADKAKKKNLSQDTSKQSINTGF
jgi:hypothetical protein